MQPPVLPAEHFEDRVRSLGRAVVLFAAGWCGYCARFTPEFERAAGRTPEGVAFAVADISDDDADPRWEQYGVRVVPTVIYFEDGAPRARLDGQMGRGIQPKDFQGFLGRLA